MTYPLDAVSYAFNHEGQRLVVTRRQGANAAMVATTLAHFRLAKAALAQGLLHIEDCPSPALDEQHGIHDAPLVTVWGDAIYNKDGKPITISLNICTEQTTANDLLRGVEELANGIAESKDIDISQYLPTPAATNGKLATTAQEFHQHAQANGGAVDLVQQFPRTDTDKTTKSPQASDSNATSEGIFIANFDNRKESFNAYCEQYIGQTVTVRISKIANMVREKRDKTNTYHVWEFTPFFNDEPGQYVATNLNQFQPDKNSYKWDWHIYKQLVDLVPNVGDMVTGEFNCTFKLNESGGRVYWNITKIQRMDATPQAPTADDDFYGGGELSEDELNELVANQSEIPF